MLSAALALLLILQSSEPTLTVTRDKRPAIDRGETVLLEITVDVPEPQRSEPVRLLPLGLQNMQSGQIRHSVSLMPGNAVLRYQFVVPVTAVAEGSGIVDEIQVTVGQDNPPRLLTWPGWTVHIRDPLRWEAVLPLLLLALLPPAGIAGYWLYRKKKRPDASAAPGPERLRRQRTMEELEALRIRAEWRDMVARGFSELLRCARQLPGVEDTEGRLDGEALGRLQQRWTDFPGAWRLGEEVRYGGYAPDKNEARFMTGVIRSVHADLDAEEQNMTQKETH